MTLVVVAVRVLHDPVGRRCICLFLSLFHIMTLLVATASFLWSAEAISHQYLNSSNVVETTLLLYNVTSPSVG